MPSHIAKLLEFSCPGNCGSLYGEPNIVYPIEWEKNRKKKKKHSKSGRRYEDRGIAADNHRNINLLKPVEYSWKNSVESKTRLQHFKYTLDKVREVISDPSLYDNTYSSEQKNEMHNLIQTVLNELTEKCLDNLRKFELQDKSDMIWDVKEVLGIDIQKDIFMLTLMVINFFRRGVKKEISSKILQWNPVKQIREYRRSYMTDPFLYSSNEPIWLYMKAIANHSKHMEQTLPGEMFPLIQEGAKVYDEYMAQFANLNWKYTWYEWFWIVRYAQVFSVGKAVKMLKYLDGDNGKISHKYIRDQIDRVLDFWKRFLLYIPLLLMFRKTILECVIKVNPDLNKEYEEILDKKRIDCEEYEKKIRDACSDTLIPDKTGFSSSFHAWLEKKYDFHNGKIIMDNEIEKIGLERIRIYHPDTRKTCIFDPIKLPAEVYERYIKEGKIQS